MDDLRGLGDTEWQFVKEITERLSALYDMEFPKEEQMYIALHLAGKHFRGNFNLRMSLNQHLVPLDICLRYDLPMTNPMLHEIKQKYVMGYTLASQAVSVLSQHYKKGFQWGGVVVKG